MIAFLKLDFTLNLCVQQFYENKPTKSHKKMKIKKFTPYWKWLMLSKYEWVYLLFKK